MNVDDFLYVMDRINMEIHGVEEIKNVKDRCNLLIGLYRAKTRCLEDFSRKGMPVNEEDINESMSELAGSYAYRMIICYNEGNVKKAKEYFMKSEETLSKCRDVFRTSRLLELYKNFLSS